MTGNTDHNGKRGFASMSDQEHQKISSEGGKASAKNKKGAAGSTEAARRGGENSHKNQ